MYSCLTRTVALVVILLRTLGEPLHTFSHLLKSACCCAIFLSPSNLATGHDNGDIVIWTAHQGTFKRTIAAHKGAVNDLCILNGKTLISAGGDGLVKLFEISTWFTLHTFDVDKSAFSLLVDSGLLYVSVSDVGVLTYDLQSKALLGAAAVHEDDLRGMHLV